MGGACICVMVSQHPTAGLSWHFSSGRACLWDEGAVATSQQSLDAPVMPLSFAHDLDLCTWVCAPVPTKGDCREGVGVCVCFGGGGGYMGAGGPRAVGSHLRNHQTPPLPGRCGVVPKSIQLLDLIPQRGVDLLQLGPGPVPCLVIVIHAESGRGEGPQQFPMNAIPGTQVATLGAHYHFSLTAANGASLYQRVEPSTQSLSLHEPHARVNSHRTASHAGSRALCTLRPP